MASRTKKTSSKKHTDISKTLLPYKLKSEIISITATGISIIIAASVYTGFGWDFAGDVLKGIFGIGAYILPICIAVFSLCFAAGDKYKIGMFKTLMCIMIFIDIISFIHLVGDGNDVMYAGIWQYTVDLYKNGSAANGGVVGGYIGGIIYYVLKWGAFAVIFSTASVGIVLLTGRSIYDFIGYIYSSLMDTVNKFKDDAPEYEEYYDYEDDYSEYDEPEEKEESERDMPKIDKETKEIKETEDKSGKERNKKKVKKLKMRKSEILYKRYKDRLIIHNGKVVMIDIKKDEAKSKVKLSLITDEIREIRRKRKPEVFKNIEFNDNVVAFLKPDKNTHKEDNKEETEKIKEIQTEKDEINIKSNSDLKNANVNDDIKETFDENEPEIIQAEEQELLTEAAVSKVSEYIFPKLDFLSKNPDAKKQGSKQEILENSRILIKTLKSFNVEAKVTEISKGPTVTRYEISPGEGIKISKILGLADNLALSLAAQSIRIEAPIPGKAAVGIEIPNKEIMSVYLSEVICESKFQSFSSKTAFGLGKDIAGNVIVKDIAKMPHLLIAGATGSGKSVCINTLIMSILYKSAPEDVRLIMVDPKVVELSVYNGIPHLLVPVVTEPDKAAGALNWAVSEMMDRYDKFAEMGTRNLEGYNRKIEKSGGKKIPQIIIIIDELADLMMVAAKEVESSICRLAQLARAAGIHLIIATQRPSVDVITGLIKANIPSRIAFAVSSATDSRTILDSGGAEKLLGKGDMLLKAVDMNKALRIQGAFVSDREVERIVDFIKEKNKCDYDDEVISKIESSCMENDSISADKTPISDDELINEAIEFVVNKGSASISMLQRRFKIGYNRAARIMDELEERGIVGADTKTSKQRQVLMDKYQWQEYSDRHSDYI